jgi:hypothetical protein
VLDDGNIYHEICKTGILRNIGEFLVMESPKEIMERSEDSKSNKRIENKSAIIKKYERIVNLCVSN